VCGSGRYELWESTSHGQTTQVRIMYIMSNDIRCVSRQPANILPSAACRAHRRHDPAFPRIAGPAEPEHVSDRDLETRLHSSNGRSIVRSADSFRAPVQEPIHAP
jgi:hypothetical protein